jgi:hypothetical protein|tara:strand:+ start:166 stop:732 length:567 start_codon:yes stop_codon:yes gene_type:complete
MSIIGTFKEDLDIYLADNKGRTGASKRSISDIPVMGAKSKGPLLPGKMYCFNYYTTEESFYDTKPLVIGLGESDDGHQLGINLHYMPYEARIPFLTQLVSTLKTQIQYNLDDDPLMEGAIATFKWKFIKQALGKKYNLTYCVRQYRMDRMKDPYAIGYRDWYIGAVNNEDQFFGGNINQAQSLYYKNI